MNEIQIFRQGSRSCLISLLNLVLAIAAMAVSTNYHYLQHISCRGMLGAGFPILFICDDWGGGSPTGSWGKIDFVDVLNGGIRPGGFLIDLLFYIVLIFIILSVVSSFLTKGADQRDLWWTAFILIGFISGLIFTFLTTWSSDVYDKNPPVGTSTPVIPTAMASEAIPSVTPLATLAP